MAQSLQRWSANQLSDEEMHRSITAQRYAAGLKARDEQLAKQADADQAEIDKQRAADAADDKDRVIDISELLRQAHDGQTHD